MIRVLTALLTLGLLVQMAPADIVTASQDHTIRNNGPSVENGIHIKQSTSNTTDRYGMFRFDSSLFGTDVTAATFLLTANSDTVTQFQGTFDYRIYGIPDGTFNDEIFTEGGANYDPTLGTTWDGANANRIDASALTLLGDATGVAAGDTINLGGSNLLSFVQADSNDTVSLVVIRLSNGGNSTFRDRTTASPPRLDITTVPEPSSLALLGLGGLLVVRRRRD